MTDRPILFSGPMVRALLAGTKTQTRRVLMRTRNGTPVEMHPDGRCVPFNDPKQWGFPYYDRSSDSTDVMFLPEYVKRLFEIGDRLYVREAFEFWSDGHDCELKLAADNRLRQTGPNTGEIPDAALASYFRMVDRSSAVRGYINCPGMHMPRWASRLTLTVTEVRVQRLQEISSDDALAEGVDALDWQLSAYRSEHRDGVTVSSTELRNYVPAYRRLWDSLNSDRADGAYAWAANPWVVAVTFTVIRQNVDQITEERS
ncbi:hypothetical protein [Mesorhizobium silamurunense]|uniref:hypothetical protein n=1 Tax=Mesorhizobium silamurunense TaxID=499528 RepID=UPI001785BF41|nr:hypothetical protein [Mesorhizobium silamurunense]